MIRQPRVVAFAVCSQKFSEKKYAPISRPTSNSKRTTGNLIPQLRTSVQAPPNLQPTGDVDIHLRLALPLLLTDRRQLQVLSSWNSLSSIHGARIACALVGKIFPQMVVYWWVTVVGSKKQHLKQTKTLHGFFYLSSWDLPHHSTKVLPPWERTIPRRLK